MAAPIPDLYERYKIGTKRVVQWLAEASGKSADNGTVVRMPLREMTELANHILETAISLSPAALKDIDSIIRILEDVIAGRSECAVWYTRATVNVDKDESFDRSHQGHQHFIDVLRAVLACLKETSKLVPERHGGSCKGKKLGTVSTPSAKTAKVTGNIYEGLSVQEPSIELLTATAADLSLGKNSSLSDASAPALPKMSKNKRKKERRRASKAPVFELETQAEDGEFALWCLLKDCYQVRIFVKELWQEYVAGDTSLPTAASITEKAFVLVQHATEALIANHPAFATMEQVADHLKIVMNVKGKRIEGFQCKGLNDVARNIEAEELLCAPAYLQLLISRHNSTAYKTTDAAQDVDRKVGYHANTHPLARTAFELLFDVKFRTQDFLDFIALVGSDKFTFDLFKTFHESVTPLHTVIEYQIYMDIMELTNKISLAPYHNLLTTKEILQARIQTFERGFDGTLARLTPDCSKSEIRTRCQEIMSRGLEDYAQLTRDYEPNYDSVSIHLEYPWIIKLPVYGGKVIENIMMQMYIDGLSVCDTDCIVMSMAHIYRACRSSGLLRKPWKDMDFFVSSTQPENLKLPPAGWSFSALLNSVKHYGAAVGVLQGQCGNQTSSTSSFKTRAPLPSAEEIEQRRVRFAPQLKFVSGCAAKSGDPTVTMQPSMDILRSSCLQWAYHYLNDPTNLVDEAICGRWRTGDFTATDLLSIFKLEAGSVETYLAFDHHTFMLDCLDLFGCILAQAHLDIFHKLPTNYSIVQLTNEILWEAAEIGIIQMRKGSGAALLEMSLIFEEQVCHSSGGRISQSCQDLRDQLWRCSPDFAIALTDLAPDAAAPEDGESEDPVISIAGRDVAFQTGKLSDAAEEKLRKSNERSERMAARIRADRVNGIPIRDSIRAFQKEEMKAMKGAET